MNAPAHTGRPCKPAGEFGLALYRARGLAGLRQEDAAILVGVSVKSWSRWERGEAEPIELTKRVVIDKVLEYAAKRTPEGAAQ